MTIYEHAVTITIGTETDSYIELKTREKVTQDFVLNAIKDVYNKHKKDLMSYDLDNQVLIQFIKQNESHKYKTFFDILELEDKDVKAILTKHDGLLLKEFPEFSIKTVDTDGNNNVSLLEGDEVNIEGKVFIIKDYDRMSLGEINLLRNAKIVTKIRNKYFAEIEIEE